MSFKNKCLEYFDFFSNKKIDSVMVMCDTYVSLKDWDISVSGKNEVRNAVMKIFDNVDTIKIFPISLHREDNVVFCQIKIIVNNDEELDVIDVITFNEKGYIRSIKAYKC